MPVSASKALRVLARRWPPPGIDVDHLLDDLDAAAAQYAELAADYGSSEQWRVWREIERERGRTARDAIADLDAQQCRWLASWALASGERELGIAAYEAYLGAPGEIARSSEETVEYLLALAGAGRVDDAIATVDALGSDPADHPGEQQALCVILASHGNAEAALARIEPICARYHDSGDAWATLGIVLRALHPPRQASHAVIESAKLGVQHESTLAQLLACTGTSDAAWRSLEESFAPASLDHDAEWRARPGARLRPTSSASPHAFGGDAFQMPECVCGHAIRLWFALDLRDIPELHERLPAWTLFPLLGCVDCDAWMGRHDYETTVGSVRLVNVAFTRGPFTEPHRETAAIPRQPVRLEWVPPAPESEEVGDWERPQVGGAPAWTQGPLRIWCRSCREEMTFVAAMASTTDFDVCIPVNNESGYQYHFACDACRTLSVIAQWT